MVNNVAFFTVPMKADPQAALGERLSKFEKLSITTQAEAKKAEYKKQLEGREIGLYA